MPNKNTFSLWSSEGAFILAITVISVLFCGPAPEEDEPEPNTTPKFSTVHKILTSSCGTSNCHTTGGTADYEGAYVLSGVVSADHATLIENGERINTASPANSNLLKKPTNVVDHDGGQVFTKDSNTYSTLLKWVQGGAKND